MIRSCSLTPNFAKIISASRFSRKVATVSGDSNKNMDKNQNPPEKSGDAMSHSFGEGYSTRSDEEGFGGTMGGKQSQAKLQIDEAEIHENHPAYDKSQGSEVAEKEKGRHKTNDNSST
ncbi:hypothetical protein ACFE04_023816 [Oxalis oulophora]